MGRVLNALLLAATAVSAAASADMTLDAPGHACTDRDSPLAHGGKPGSAWTLIDWRGRETEFSGVFNEEGISEIGPLPTGYYRLACDEGTKATLAVVQSPEGRLSEPLSFYGTDSAQSAISGPGKFACPWNGGDTYRTVSDLVWLSGIRHVRDRLVWNMVNPRRDVFDFGRFMDNAETLRARGIAVTDVFADCPPWAGKYETLPPGRHKQLPVNLNATYDFCLRVAGEFGNRMEAWEFWNEPDIHGTPEPVWEYAAALKAAYLGFKAGNPGRTVLLGSLCQKPDAPYARVLYENDAAKFSDAYNYHIYWEPSKYPDLFSVHRAFMKRYGIGDRPIWLTEHGTNLEGPATDNGPVPGLKAHSPDQELVLAEFYPKSQIALQMEGVARSFFFVFGAYNERNGEKDWGVMRRDGTVKPVYSAMATMIREVGAARLAGEVKVGEGAKAFLFNQPDGSQTLSFWSVSPVDTQGTGVVSCEPDFAMRLTIPAPDGTYRISDLCGWQSSAMATNGVLSLDATRYPAYVSGLRGVVADTPARPAGKAGPYVPEADEDLSVVLRVELDMDDFELTGNKTCAIPKGGSGRLRVQAWNFGDTAKTGRVDVAGGTLDGLPETIVLGPRGTPPATFDCVLRAETIPTAVSQLVLTGVFDGRRSSRASIPMVVPDRLFDARFAKPLDWRDPANWTRNDSADTYSVTWDETEQALRFDFAWGNPAVGRWFYPIYTLRLPEESFGGATAIQFEVKTLQDKVENDFRNSLLMLVEKGGADRWLDYAAPNGTWERRYILLGGISELGDTASFRIGANPCGMRCTFWIRAVKVIKSEGKGTKTAVPTGQGVRQSETVSEKSKDEQNNE